MPSIRFSMLKYDGNASSVTMFPIRTTQYSIGRERHSFRSTFKESKKSGDAGSGKRSVGCHAEALGISSGSIICSAQSSILYTFFFRAEPIPLENSCASNIHDEYISMHTA
jgi:hypothetical protein